MVVPFLVKKTVHVELNLFEWCTLFMLLLLWYSLRSNLYLVLPQKNFKCAKNIWITKPIFIIPFIFATSWCETINISDFFDFTFHSLKYKRFTYNIRIQLNILWFVIVCTFPFQELLGHSNIFVVYVGTFRRLFKLRQILEVAYNIVEIYILISFLIIFLVKDFSVEGFQKTRTSEKIKNIKVLFSYFSLFKFFYTLIILCYILTCIFPYR